MINLTINHKKIKAEPGQTILEVARDNGFMIPTLCEHPDLEIKANCRICVIEAKGRPRLLAACSTPVEEGMEILTESARVKKSRRLNLELLFGEHTRKCSDCTLLYNCELLKLAAKYGAAADRFPNRKLGRKTYRLANAVEIDGSQCIDCNNCVAACHELQHIDYLRLAGHGINQEVVPVEKKACIYCGQCTLHCPVGAAQEKYDWPEVEKVLRDKSRVVVAQFAPSVRIAIGEEFGLPYGYNAEGKCYSALKKLGFKHVFDVNFGADITTMVEAEELLERLGNKKAVFPMTTSCCPAWVAYVESHHPELLPHLTTARSPHIHCAGAIKTYWAEHMGISAKKITVVSIVPCTAKKYEAARSELGYRGRPLVDYALTTREFAYLIKRHKIDFKNLPDGKGEDIFNSGSGAAAIYGASGGVMESALRTANALVCAKSRKASCENRLEFKEVRGLAGFKEATVNLDGKKIRVGVVNGIGHIERVLPHLKKYHYIEVMACPGGCLGGGGQPIPTTTAIRQKRLAGLYNIDRARPKRRAHENKAMLEFYKWARRSGLKEKILETKFQKKKGSILKVINPPKKARIGLASSGR